MGCLVSHTHCVAERVIKKKKMVTWLRNARPYLMLLAVQFGSAGMFIFAMDAIKKGMSHYVFIVYRNAIASVTLAPFAFVLERYLLLYLPCMHIILFMTLSHVMFSQQYQAYLALLKQIFLQES